MVVVHKRGRIHRNVDALSRAETSPSRYLVGVMSTLYDLSTDNEEDSEQDIESDDSFEDMSEAERLQFLTERYQFINLECARLACLPEESQEKETVQVELGRYFGEIEPGSDFGSDSDPEFDDTWLQAAELEADPDENDEENYEPDWIQHLQAMADYCPSPTTGDSSAIETDKVAENRAVLAEEVGSELEPVVDPVPLEVAPSTTMIEWEDKQPKETDDEVLAEYLQALSDGEVHEFLARQVDSSSSSEYGTALQQLEIESGTQNSNIVTSAITTREMTDGKTKECSMCSGGKVPIKRCLSCGRAECHQCLMRGWDWTEEQLSRQAWICVLCAEKEEPDVAKDALTIYYLKTTRFPLGLDVAKRAQIKRISKRYRWDEEMNLVMKAANRKYSERVIPWPEEREEIVRDLHKYGHLGINRVAGTVVTNYFWKGMYDDVKRVIHNCPCAANKRKITVVRPPRPTPIPLGPLDLIALDLMTLTRSYQGNRYLITAQDYFSKWPEVKAVPQKTAQAVAEFIEEHIFARFGYRIEIVTDQGREFLGQVNQTLTKGLVIHRTTSAYRAQANGLVEHLNGVLGRSLAATLEQGDLHTWERGLRDFLTGYRG